MTDVYAIDYDDTFTHCPAMWRRVLPIMSEHIPVICATSRSSTDHNKAELHAALDGYVHAIVFCGNHIKSEICGDCGYRVLVWMDNDPRTDRHWMPLWWCKLAGAAQWVKRRICG